jgi:CRISPR-associated endonuclease Csn1
LLRELRKPKKVREKIWKESFSAERRNDEIRQEIQQGAKVVQPSPRDVEKHKLWKESGNICPYCLKGMSWANLFGDDSEYHVDHIIPWKRCLDDSFANKVLCHADCNQNKGDRTPYEAFNGDPDRYDRIIKCVAGFNADKDTLHEKVKRFEMGPKELEEFLAKRTAQQFNDSAYASRLAADYLGLLYGGRHDEQGNVRVQARSGGLTRYFREAWNLNSILGDGEHKNGGKTHKPRHDHRHHAVDGVVIAVTDQGMVQRLNNAAKRGWVGRPGRFGHFDEPWPGFRNELKKEVMEKLVVSHRVSKKVSGALHKDTNYSTKEFGQGVRRHRVLLTDLSEKDVLSDDVIADPGVRKLVRQRLAVLGGGEPKKLFAEDKNLPHFEATDGRRIPVKKVRINEIVKTRPIGKGDRTRFVKPGGNHHLEIFGLPGSDGRDKKWGAPRVVTMLEPEFVN